MIYDVTTMFMGPSPCSATRVVPRGTSRGVKKLTRTNLPDLGKLSDISEYLLGCVSAQALAVWVVM